MNEIKAYENENYSKSNFLISGKFKSSLYENKILAISLAKIAKHEYKTDPDTKEIVCTMRAAELKEMLNAKNGSFYDTLEVTAAAMTARSIGISNPESHEFEYISLVTKADYKKGVFNIRYSPHFAPYIADLKSNYTVLSLPIMLNFESVWTLRLYELLRSKCYYTKGQNRSDGVYIFGISLAELKLELGAVNADTDAVRKVLHKTVNPDYDKALERSKDKSFETWYEFKRKVLEKAIKEIEEKTPMRVQFQPQRGGKGGKIYHITFTITNETTLSEPAPTTELTEDEMFNIEVEVKTLLSSYALSIADVRSLCKAASYDVVKIRNATELLNSTKNVTNVVGWLLSAIKKDYKANPAQKTVFNNFDQRDLDIEELTRGLLQE